MISSSEFKKKKIRKKITKICKRIYEKKWIKNNFLRNKILESFCHLHSPLFVHSCRFRSTPLEHRFSDGHQLHLKLMSFFRHVPQSVKMWQVRSGVNLRKKRWNHCAMLKSPTLPDQRVVGDLRTRKVHPMVLEDRFPPSVVNCFVDDVSIADANLHRMFVWSGRKVNKKLAKLSFVIYHPRCWRCRSGGSNNRTRCHRHRTKRH